MIIIALGSTLVIAVQNNSNNGNNNFAVNGHVKILVDGVTVVDKNDLLQQTFTEFVACNMFGFTDGINPNGCAYILGTLGASSNCIQSGWSAFNSPTIICTLDAIALSSDTTNPAFTSNACPSIINSAGLTPQRATLSQTFGVNSVTLTSSWTAGTSATVNKVCLMLYDWNNNVVDTVGGASFAQDLVNPFSVTASQTIQIQWTFSW